ncbi:hypothetical protein PR202_ga10789 [Eleusine coracana subsp. coracana]|uniref:Rubicon Homology domain-containing protein n=1 Tax=Eleusine coracana subsp. coracana TaxID=191504 RepID=A0AAV5C7M1_ELECO|nr:hypothetical protein PR202_ga10789 [Eleusine coracana subsp. coracana]
MDPPRRSAGGPESEASSAAGSDAEDDRYCSANSALATPSSYASLRPSSDFWDQQMDFLLDDRPTAAGFPKSHQLSRIQAQARLATDPAPPAAAGEDASARQESSSGSPAVPPLLDPNQVDMNRLDDSDLFDDMVQEMEAILLNSGERHENGSFIDNRSGNARQAHHFRDGSTTASTSGTDDAYMYPFARCPSKIDWVEVVGAKQRTGDVSFAVLPARVLHHWDFSLYPISQLAKAYLDSIYDQPMLCVSAVNPFLFSKVPALLNIMSIRKKIAAMLPCVQCPFRNSILKGLGVRRYLLDGNDFFALRDLVDLSKGAFAGTIVAKNNKPLFKFCFLQTALPVKVQTMSNRILVHITEQCLVCYDAGVPCAARQACDDPLSLIFPFQEDEATKCGLCGSIFHKQCFRKICVCPCGKASGTGRKIAALEQAVHGGTDRPTTESLQPSSFSSSSGFFSDFLSKARPDKLWKPRNSSPVILMGSLPDTSV